MLAIVDDCSVPAIEYLDDGSDSETPKSSMTIEYRDDWGMFYPPTLPSSYPQIVTPEE